MALTTADQISTVPPSLGRPVSLPVSSLAPIRHHDRSTSEGSTLLGQSKSTLPPAVSNVPSKHIRSYVHSKKVNNYLVGSTLGEGSFAKVKEALHMQVGEKVAMKVIDKKKAQQDPYVAKNFRREAKLLQMVRHPNILSLLEVIETDTSFYLITELCSGGELMKHIYKKGKLDETETRKYMRQIISAIDHLHRAGIIHRDLKVENMLLDGNMDIRIIDFGLSNEQYIQGENGMIHCSTQCGSPAYAAPELLGHKAYGPEVDIWSIGVNMYAMLTGCLPYTVEPFNITALHAKMLENKMNPIPDNLSANCKSLLQRLLDANPENRIKMGDIMTHPWINQGYTLPFGPAPFPNHLTMNDVNMDIVDHMINVLEVEQSMDDLIQELISNRATGSACAYFLLSARLDRYQKRYPAKKTRTRLKSKLSSEFDEVVTEEDELKSTKSVPTSRLRRPGHSRPTSVQIPERKPQDSPADRPLSLSRSLYDQEPQPSAGHNHGHRKSLPPVTLQEDLRKYYDYRTTKPPPSRGNTWGQQPQARKSPSPRMLESPRKNGPLEEQQRSPFDTLRRNQSLEEPQAQPRSTNMPYRGRRKSLPAVILEEDTKKLSDRRSTKGHSQGNTWGSRARRPSGFSIESIEDNADRPYDTDYLSHSHNDPLGPVFPPNKGMSRNYSHGHALNKLRDDLKEKFHPPQAHSAWRSNPGSRNPSRHGSRVPSSSSSRRTSVQSSLEELYDEGDLFFSPAKVREATAGKEARTLSVRMHRQFLLGSPIESDDVPHLPTLHSKHFN